MLDRTRDASCYDISPLNNCTIVETRCKLLYNIKVWQQLSVSHRESAEQNINIRLKCFLWLCDKTPWWTLLWPTPWSCPPGTSWTDLPSCATCSTPPPTRSTDSPSQRACWSQVTHLKLCVCVKERLHQICYWECLTEMHVCKLLLRVCCLFLSPWAEGEDPHLDERETDWTTWLRTTC